MKSGAFTERAGCLLVLILTQKLGYRVVVNKFSTLIKRLYGGKSVFLAQDNSEAVVLAILCDFQKQDKRQIIREILNRVQQLTGNNEVQY